MAISPYESFSLNSDLIWHLDERNPAHYNLFNVKYVIAKPEGFARTDMAGVPRRVYWATAPMTGWKIALNVPETLILQPVRVLAIQVTLIGAMAFFLMIFMVTIVARRLADEIRRERGRIRDRLL